MAEARKVMPTEPAFHLTLDADEAGYLQELLYAHIGGGLTTWGQPFGRILEALSDAGAPHRSIRNLNEEAPNGQRMPYSVLWPADTDESDSWKWWEPKELQECESDGTVENVPHSDDVSYL
jgi:hypothetical protein